VQNPSTLLIVIRTGNTGFFPSLVHTPFRFTRLLFVYLVFYAFFVRFRFAFALRAFSRTVFVSPRFSPFSTRFHAFSHRFSSFSLRTNVCDHRNQLFHHR
jgi:hypothetical protein